MSSKGAIRKQAGIRQRPNTRFSQKIWKVSKIERFCLGKSRLAVDTEATAAWYKHASEWDCPCAACRNFIALANGELLPRNVMQTLRKLAIPPEKATYVCNLYDDFYQFSYRIAGNILKTPEVGDPNPGEGRCCHEAYPYGTPGFPAPHFDLEFMERLPWVLKTGPEE